MEKAESEEIFGTEFKRILPPEESSIFSYKLDVASGHWILWADSLPKIPPSFEVIYEMYRDTLSLSYTNTYLYKRDLVLSSVTSRWLYTTFSSKFIPTGTFQ